MENQFNEKQGLIQKFLNSLYNFRAYPYYLKETLGKAILYIFILVLITSIFTSAKYLFTISKGFKVMESELLNELPDFTIDSTGFQTNATMPLIYGDAIEEMVLIIDNTGTVKETDLSNYTEAIFVLKNKVIIKQNPLQTKTYYFSDFGDFTLNKSDISDFIGIVKILIYVLLIGVAPLLSFIGKLLSLYIVLAVGGLIFNAILNLQLSYKEICKLGAYSLTLPILIKTTLTLLGVSLPFFALIYYGLALSYLFLGMKEVKNLYV
ncbi:MAG: DUF1189 domain-containing protein [Clostridium sp.]